MAKTKASAMRALPSKTHSCSELAASSAKLIKVKKEQMTPEQYDKQIQDSFSLSLYLYLALNPDVC